ncbi:hypothetical protein RclHR1_00550016 [Rhizophagus clarus]|uniref:AIG1-type G domain-containing protein n=1 Tax=Rhizophagus clarus TaxID=94130 RepID=A0A2Z6RP77_9GLOM|nr:hypothetical protein RclHR1_00550016 [Rhizophagus clarus]GES80236.1 hypothetical protein GLOIN_2v1469980 [Rhizophagus clarus]
MFNKLRNNPQNWVDKKYSKENEEKIDIRRKNIRNKIGLKSNLHGPLEIKKFKSRSVNLEKLKLTQLKIISCPQITKIELSGLIKLKSLVVNKCSRLTNLEIVNCPQLTEFDLYGCPKLTKLDISHNKLKELTELDVSNLFELNCSNTSIEKLSLKRCPDIIKLICSNNEKLIYLDISNCSKLEYLDCSNSGLTSLDVSNCPNIKEIITPPNLSDNVIGKKKIFKNILIIGCTGSGKSTLANVLAGNENFEESENGVSEIETFQKSVFEWEGVKYRVIDTTGFEHTENKVLSRIKEGISSVPEGINQILLVIGKNFTDEISQLDRLGLSESDFLKYTTIVRTKFSNFKNRDECKKDKDKLCWESEINARIIESCKGMIYVDNPPDYYYDDDDDDNKEANISKKTRERSRFILLSYLEKVCQEQQALQHINIDKETPSASTNKDKTRPVKVKEENERNEFVVEEKRKGKLENESVKEPVTETEKKCKVERGVSNPQLDREQNKLENIGVDNFTSLPLLPQLITNNQQMIQQLKLNHGLSLNGYNIQPSEQAIVTEGGKLNMRSYNGQPIVYTNINDTASSVNLLNYNSDKNNFSNKLQPSDVCINFPIAEVTYNSNLSESFLKCVDNDESLYELYGHVFARKTLIGGKLFIKELNLANSTQINGFMLYLTCAYKSAKYNIENPINNLPVTYLPRIHTLDEELLDTPEKISDWLINLYQIHKFDIISYKDLIPVNQLKNNLSSEEYFETLIEKQPGVTNFKEKLSLEEWVGNVVYINLLRWIKDFHFLQGIRVNKFYKMETTKKIAASLIKVPIVNPSKKSHLEIIRSTNKVEEFLISNNIYSIKVMSSFPFINMIQLDNLSSDDYNFLVKFEKYEIHIRKDYIKPSVEFEQAINEALENMKPFKALQDVFDEYGHVFPQKIILGRSFKRNITKPHDIPNRSDLKPESLKSYLNELNISYLLTRRGNIIEKNELFDLIQDLNDDLEIIELDNIISLCEILDKEQQEKINNIISNYKQDNYKIIMTGIADLKDLDNNNTEHYKRISVQPSLEDENYEVIGSIISKQKDSKLEEYLLKFRLYDFNGFSVMIKTLKKTDIKIEECYILWMIIGIPSKLSVFSPKNQGLQVKYKEFLTLQHNQLKIKIPIPLSQGFIISVNAYHSQITYGSINIKLVEWSEGCIRFQINESKNDSLKNIDEVVNSINCNIYVLGSDYNTFRIDNGNEEYPLDLIGYKLSEENFNKNLTYSDE